MLPHYIVIHGYYVIKIERGLSIYTGSYDYWKNIVRKPFILNQETKVNVTN